MAEPRPPGAGIGFPGQTPGLRHLHITAAVWKPAQICSAPPGGWRKPHLLTSSPSHLPTGRSCSPSGLCRRRRRKTSGPLLLPCNPSQTAASDLKASPVRQRLHPQTAIRKSPRKTCRIKRFPFQVGSDACADSPCAQCGPFSPSSARVTSTPTLSSTFSVLLSIFLDILRVDAARPVTFSTTLFLKPPVARIWRHRDGAANARHRYRKRFTFSVIF